MKDQIDYLLVNAEENYLYTRKLAEYIELNQDLYLWVIESAKLQGVYYNTEGKSAAYATNFVVEGKKIDRPELPPLNLILKSFFIGYTASDSNNYTYINFDFPTATENRKFSLKIGRINDNAILTKIKNNDYTGITDLLSYAKSNEAVYFKQLETTSKAYFRSNTALFDGRSLLEDKAYYYIYAEFDDENGKYYPIEGITLGQAWLSSTTSTWDLYAYTSGDFKWDNLSSTYTPNDGKKDDTTTAQGVLPQTGATLMMIGAVLTISIIGIIFYKKYRNYKDIN